MTKRKTNPRRAASPSTEFERQIADIERMVLDEAESDEAESDEDLALEFLAGETIKNADGTITHKFLDPGSDKERDAQAALVRLLRNGLELSGLLRHRLAALFDPSHTAEGRKLVIDNRASGKQPDHIIDIEIARDIAAAEAQGVKIDSAVSAAEKRYAVSEATVRRAWAKHGQVWRNAFRPPTVN